MAQSEKEIIDEFKDLLEQCQSDATLTEYINRLHDKYHGRAEKLPLADLIFLLDNANNCDIKKIFTYHFHYDNLDNVKYLMTNYNINFNDLSDTMRESINENNFDKINFLIDNGYNIYFHNDTVLKNVLCWSECHKIMLDFFLSKGLHITDDVITYGFGLGTFETGEEYVNLLIDCGIEKERIALNYWIFLKITTWLSSFNSIPYMILLFKKLGVDLNESIDQFAGTI